jgi:hypothetical protein
MGEDGPAALVPVRAVLPLALALVASGGGVGVTALPDKDELNSCLGRLFAAAVSKGGGWGRSRPDELPPLPNGPRDEDADLGDVSLVAELGLDIVSTACAGSVAVVVVVLVEESVCWGTCSRGLNLACSGSFESTISVVEVEFPNKLIFFARATRDERRRSRTPCGGPPPPLAREESSFWRGFDEARMTD